MLEIYTKPLRVYILLGALAIWGIFSGLSLPVSLFPMSNQVTIEVQVSYGSLTKQQFFDTYGKKIERTISSARVNKASVEKLTASYRHSSAEYQARFDWGADPTQAVSELQNKTQSQISGAEESIRRSLQVYSWDNNQGFFAVSFFSPLRSLDEVYTVLNPLFSPLSSKVKDAKNVGLWNPNQKEISILLSPEKLAQFEVTTQQIESAIQAVSYSLGGGKLKSGANNLTVQLPKSVNVPEDLGNVRVSRSEKPPVLLRDLATIALASTEEAKQKFKTSGVESLILFASPRQGGNIKNMGDQLIKEIEILSKQWPSDIQYRVLVNPSEFINRSILSVVREVFLAAFLAVVVLFFFIGSFKNVATAAIEIPLSLLLAFILMRLSGMNMNMISLGGLALSAGMNVDASVVVLENIFRHFRGQRDQLSLQEKARILVEAVNEVRGPIIASTIASLVVFAPLIYTNGLANSLLADLAKAVVFSHGLSAIVALVLVPTIRLQLIQHGGLRESHSPAEGFLRGLERRYTQALRSYLNSNFLQVGSMLSAVGALVLLILLVLPGLKREIIGKPETDWLVLGPNSPLLTSSKMVEAELEKMETTIFAELGDRIAYTFAQVYQSTSGVVMVRFKERKDMEKTIENLQKKFPDTATTSYFVSPWNPSELYIPEAPQMRLEISGSTAKKRLVMAQDLHAELTSRGLFDRVSSRTDLGVTRGVLIKDIGGVAGQQIVLNKAELAHYLRVATDGSYAGGLTLDSDEVPIYLRLNRDVSKDISQLQALPVGFQGRLVPLGALGSFSIEEMEPEIYREDNRDLIKIEGKLDKGSNKKPKAEFDKFLAEFRQRQLAKQSGEPAPTLTEAVADKELRDALEQLKSAVLISVVLIFITMILQLGSLAQSLLVLVAIPLGFIGVLLSLFAFQSSLSLNSGLGTILLNGIAVANSIILVDFIQKLFRSGKSASEATVEASSARLRPILMTSLTTGLGMLPIALGLGEGGKILQPLGIAVCGGLWVSTLLTLFFVPALQYQYLHWREKRGLR